ncbi:MULTISPECIES: YicC/YloC family endoribonuclease [Caproicibacterium]|uniref:YicC family protein n=1 Tax=Caproicibacterium lactatifermentans TaxID=2666138 RepID=A0A859DPK4_9FIRM|nr:YicC/YloC family endoribonuclease [Caproicibacterium lactatifermentans]ARP50271.1 YicC family protein [Ruminococcaceae bacterium CPB6]MDD4807912.1 YicC family protein [Oscillospiraceae bacterium]QKN24007.1 YicC family protein [Caproicibacterium lactatifermentans]QKO30922.1 YicC family protein [Caproicibacterium lactatifermentans]
MIKSMTGYGRYEAIINGRHIQAEVKSVNHRYFEFSARISRGYGFLEDRIRTYLQSRISRGKVDAMVLIEPVEDANVQISVNHGVAAGYIAAMKDLCSTYGLKNDLSVSDLAHFDGIFTVFHEPENEEEVWTDVQKTLDHAMDSFAQMRLAEGQKMKEDVASRAHDILKIVEKVEQRSPETVEAYRRRLQARLQEVLQDQTVDEQRIVTEAAIFADKVAVDEETVRLRSHLSQFCAMLESDGPVGRKLDFLVQEMNREANTIGSKCTDTQIAYLVVDIKAEIEKIREQIQNIE